MDVFQTLEAVTLAQRNARPSERAVATESPIAVSILGIGYAVMMATPADLEDFALGFAHAERLIDDAAQLLSVEVRESGSGILLGIELAPECHDRVLERVRHRVSESGCGMCGIENLKLAMRPLPDVGAPPPIGRNRLFAALRIISDHQPINEVTGAAHAAACFDGEGMLLAVREDVGRHNAFDKLIGHALRKRLDLTASFVLLTSRCSYELVEKAALARVPLLVTFSAPTSLAVKRAKEAGLTLIALARSDSMLVMSDPHHRFSD